MRFTILASAIAISCCGFTSFALAQNSRPAVVPTAAPSLLLDQSDQADHPPAQLEKSVPSEGEQPSNRSPFDFLDHNTKDLAVPEAMSSQHSPSSTTDPGRPVGIRNSSHADTIIAGAKAIQASHFPPIDWVSAGYRTPNPTAIYMLREYCVAGLWDNYAAERAQQCARQMERINGGHKHCRSCGVQAGPACGSGCGHAHPVINRYRMSENSNGCTQCSEAANAAGDEVPSGSDCAQADGPNNRPAPISILPPQSKESIPGKVASLPYAIR